MAINTVKFSQFALASLANSGNMSVGYGGGVNYQTPFVNSWATATRPTPYGGLLGYNSSLNQYEYWNGSAWVQFAAGGSGTVGSGSANQLAYYASNGTAVSGLTSANSSILVTDGSGVPSWSTTVPPFTTSSISFSPDSQGIVGNIDGIAKGAGYVGQIITDVNSSGSIVTSNTRLNIANISLTAGNWLIFGSGYFINTGNNIYNVDLGISSTSVTFPLAQYITSLSSANIQGSSIGFPSPVQFANISSTASYYLVGNALFGAGTTTAYGNIFGVRIS